MTANRNTPMEFAAMTDEEIVRLAQQGNEQAAEYILKGYADILNMYAKRYFIIGGDHDDVAQEGRLGLHKAIRDYDPQCGTMFKTFASICIKRQILSAIKGANRYKNQPLNQARSMDQPLYSRESTDRTLLDTLATTDVVDPESLLLQKELFKTIAEAVPTFLSDLELRVLVMYLQGQPYTEIAQQIGRPVKSVDNAIQRVKTKMGKFFKDL